MPPPVTGHTQVEDLSAPTGAHYLAIKVRTLSRAPSDTVHVQVIGATTWGGDVEAAFV